MIKVENLSKKYNDRTILKDVSFELPDKGFVVLFGDSGSGKTTLLNSLCGVERNISGTILINNCDITHLSDKNVCKFRLNHFGYVFQNFNLMNLESVYENIKLPLDCIAILDKKFKSRRIKDLLNFLDLKHLKNNKVNTLSGGEKQRTAIGRAIVNSPDIILCDEPTGSLDEKNSEKIYKILQQISKEKLVIIASHDLEAKKYADLLLNLTDGDIDFIEKKQYYSKISKFNLFGGKLKRKKPSLPLKFKVSHSINKIKSKKWRSLITNGVLSLALSGIGISILISTSLTRKIQNAFQSIFNGNEIVMSLNHESPNTINAAFSAPKENVIEISKKYESYINGIGVTYLVNFEDFFKDVNDFYISSGGFKYVIQSLSCRSINDFKWIDDNYNNLTYPYKPSQLAEDEIVLGLSYVDMVNICFQLQIQRSYASLGEYIRKTKLQICLEVANNSWVYDDEQIFTVAAVTETNKSCIYHYDNFWNENVFENMMLLPSDDDNESYYPWEMYKLYYFSTKEDPGLFIDQTLYDEDLYDYVFERTNYNYHPNLCKIGEICKEKRVMIYYVDKYAIDPCLLNKIQKISPSFDSYFFTSDYGYSSFSSSLLNGFSKNVFISTDETKNEEAIDADTYSSSNQNINVKLPDKVVGGNYLNSFGSGVKFTSKYDELISGRVPKNLNEIVISEGLANKIGFDPNKPELYFSSVVEETYLNESNLEKFYETVKLTVVGVTSNEKLFLYHNPNWTISFFRDKLGVSMFYLIPKAIVFELDTSVNAELYCDRFQKLFNSYKFTSPSSEISKSSQNTLTFANVLLISFSLIASLISVFLLATIALINVYENKDEIALFNYLGIQNSEIYSTFIVQSLVYGFTAFFFSMVEIIFVDFLINKLISNQFLVSLSFNLNVVPIFIVFVFAILISSLSTLLSLLFIKRMKK